MFDYSGVVERTNLVDLVSRAGGNMKRVSGEWRGPCPLHLGDNPTAFSIYKDSGHERWKCWSHECGQGDAMDFVQKWLGLSKEDAYLYLGGDKKIDPGELIRLSVERAEKAEKALQATIAEANKALAELRQARKWLTYHAALENDYTAQGLWHARGIPDEWQEIWQLGYCPDFSYKSDGVLYHSPTMAIPIFDGAEEPCNIRHRLLNPINPNDKYRPDRPGLKATPFMCDPEHIDLDHVLVIEGEIKAMRTYICLDSQQWQVYGIPGKKAFRGLIDKMKGRQVWIALDPDAHEEAVSAARIVDGRIIQLAMKIDDAINGNYLDKNGLRYLLKTARKVG